MELVNGGSSFVAMSCHGHHPNATASQPNLQALAEVACGKFALSDYERRLSGIIRIVDRVAPLRGLLTGFPSRGLFVSAIM